MTLRMLTLILLSAGLSGSAQLALKVGSSSAMLARPMGVGGEIGGMLRSPMVLLGIALYGLGMLLWLFVLARIPLSVAYPFVGVSFILTMAGGIFILGEPVSLLRVAGTLLIMLGCAMVVQSA